MKAANRNGAWEARKQAIMEASRCACGKMGIKFDVYLGDLCGSAKCQAAAERAEATFVASLKASACRDCGQGFSPTSAENIVCPACVQVGLDAAAAEYMAVANGHGDGCSANCTCWL